MNIMIRSMKYEIGGDDAQVMGVKYDDTSVDTDGDAIADVICMFSKKGMRDMHKIKGDMKRNKTKAWRKKSLGMVGRPQQLSLILAVWQVVGLWTLKMDLLVIPEADPQIQPIVRGT